MGIIKKNLTANVEEVWKEKNFNSLWWWWWGGASHKKIIVEIDLEISQKKNKNKPII